MAVMAKIIIPLLFFASLAVGQLGRIEIAPGVAFYIHEPLILLILIIWIIRKKDFLKQIVSRNLSVPIQLFVFVQLISLIFAMPYNTNTQIFIGLLYVLRFILYASLYWTIGDLWSTSTILIGLYGWGFLVSILGLIQFILYPNLRNLAYLGWDPHYYRLFSTYFDPNFTGITIVFTLFFGWYLISIYKKQKKLITITLLINLIALILTFSRSSLSALGLPIVIFFLWKRQWRNILVVSSLAVIVLLTAQLGSQTQTLLRVDTSGARIINWQEGLAIFLQSPIIGQGFNLVRYARMNSEPLSHAGAGFDNSFIFVLATTGLVGLSALVFLIYRMILLGLCALKSKKYNFGILYLATIIAVIIHSLFVNSLFYPWVMIWLWLLTAGIEKNIIPFTSDK